MSIFKNISLGLFSISLFWQVCANAQEVKMYSNNAPSAEEMGDILFSNQPDDVPAMKSEGVKMRSISFGKQKKTLATQAKETSEKQSAAVGLPIKFAYNSSEVLEESKPFLNEIGRMLSLPKFSNEKLLIEGHTDAKGSEEYNRYLSERRAESVKNYLRNNYNIASNRLFVTGMGESQSLANVSPYAAVNRRVQFRKAP